jgi:phosphopantothenoylcysteine decarboxylase / phosphopantothenate---cysteine ligase
VLEGRRLLLVVTGGVAAYKSAILARRLVERGVDLKVILSDAALEFVGPQTFAAITGEQPHTTLFGTPDVSPHTDLARWSELVVVAPATAATLAKVANGISDNLVTATILATTSPVLFAPAMHTEMWEHPATRRNLETLARDGYRFVGPEIGALVGGDTGMGRMAEPESILEALEDGLGPTGPSLRILVTAGGTREPIDPVRFLGNRSSGKMGHAIATEAARRGHEVTLITTSGLPAHPAVKVVAVETADEMMSAVEDTATDLAILSAAVADFRPVSPVAGKIARADGLSSIELTSTPDILASVVARDPRPVVVGFAAETSGLERAVEKAIAKGVDLMVFNDVTEPGSGFGTDTNRVVLISPNGEAEPWPMMPKGEVAERLLDRAIVLCGPQG